MKKIAIAFFSLLAYTCSAQVNSSNASQTISLHLQNVISIEFNNTNSNVGSNVILNFNTPNDFANGVTSTNQKLTVQSNKDFNVGVKTSSPNFAYTGSATPNPVMPVSGVLSLKVVNNATGGTLQNSFVSNSFGGLTVNNQDLINNCSKGGNQEFTIKYKSTPGFNYPGGTYTTDVIYTVTQM